MGPVRQSRGGLLFALLALDHEGAQHAIRGVRRNLCDDGHATGTRNALTPLLVARNAEPSLRPRPTSRR